MQGDGFSNFSSNRNQKCIPAHMTITILWHLGENCSALVHIDFSITFVSFSHFMFMFGDFLGQHCWETGRFVWGFMVMVRLYMHACSLEEHYDHATNMLVMHWFFYWVHLWTSGTYCQSHKVATYNRKDQEHTYSVWTYWTDKNEMVHSQITSPCARKSFIDSTSIGNCTC